MSALNNSAIRVFNVSDALLAANSLEDSETRRATFVTLKLPDLCVLGRLALTMIIFYILWAEVCSC